VKSLRARLLLALVGLLVLAVAVALVAMDLRFREVGREARRDYLQALNLAVLGVVDEDASGVLRPATPLAEPRLGTPRSGLYLRVHPRGLPPSWQSASLVGANVQLPLDAGPGERKLLEVLQPDGSSLLAYAQGVAWEGLDGRTREYVFVAAEDQAAYFAQLRRLRGQFLAGGAFMLGLAALVIAVVVGFLLQPLRRMERQIAEVEVGERTTLAGDWPRELRGVAQNLNALLQAERDRAERYRTTLGNLAHSLKTPLSVLRTLLGSSAAAGPQAEMAQQVDRMQDIVQHQLRRATAGSLAPGVAWTPVLPVVEDVLGALRKVYLDRGLALTLHGVAGKPPEPGLACPLDRGDLLELVGNLADNACKFARTRVEISLTPWHEAGWRRSGVELCVDDDGPGVQPGERERILERGVRLDERVPGQGIGLSMVADMVAAHAGTVLVETSPLGGARFLVRLPGR
jgi:two-component system sensor histidine kinase PhoQ